jgi:hypothetical protein
MGFLNRFRSPEERERREREKAERDEAKGAAQAEAERQKAAAEAATQREREEAEASAQKAWFFDAVGQELAAMEIDTPADAKIAIKLARLRKKELAAEKRELASQLADQREIWRQRQAGRHSTVGLGRGTGGRMIRAGIQANRRSQRQQYANVVNSFSDARQEIDQKIATVDRLILEMERIVARGLGRTGFVPIRKGDSR